MPERPPAVERSADLFDVVHGGAERGRALAELLWRYLPLAPRTLEIGCGTGVVAQAVGADGRWVAGIDLSPARLRRAARRLFGAAARADATALPVASAALDAVYLVWLQIVPDLAALGPEVARVLRPGGRMVLVTGRPSSSPGDDVGAVEHRLDPLVPAAGRPDGMTLGAAAAGLRLVARTRWPVAVVQSPAAAAEMLERRDLRALWGIDGEAQRDLVRAVVEDLRALPDPVRPRERTLAFPLLAFENGG